MKIAQSQNCPEVPPRLCDVADMHTKRTPLCWKKNSFWNKVVLSCLVLLVLHSYRRGIPFSLEDVNIVRGLRELEQTEEAGIDAPLKTVYS